MRRRANQPRYRGRRSAKKLIEMDITSLLDILVILLVFLLKSYNSSNVILTIPDGISLPSSESVEANNPGVMIQVSESKIWVDDQEIIDSKNLPQKLYDDQNRRIIPLFNELVRKKEEIMITTKAAEGAKPFSGVANLIVDKSIRYSYLKKLMYTCAKAGFERYKFVVLGKETL